MWPGAQQWEKFYFQTRCTGKASRCGGGGRGWRSRRRCSCQAASPPASAPPPPPTPHPPPLTHPHARTTRRGACPRGRRRGTPDFPQGPEFLRPLGIPTPGARRAGVRRGARRWPCLSPAPSAWCRAAPPWALAAGCAAPRAGSRAARAPPGKSPQGPVLGGAGTKERGTCLPVDRRCAAGGAGAIGPQSRGPPAGEKGPALSLARTAGLTSSTGPSYSKRSISWRTSRL